MLCVQIKVMQILDPRRCTRLKYETSVVILQGLYMMTIILFTYFESFICFMTGTAVYQLYYELVLFCTHMDCRSVIENNIPKLTCQLVQKINSQ